MVKWKERRNKNWMRNSRRRNRRRRGLKGKEELKARRNERKGGMEGKEE